MTQFERNSWLALGISIVLIVVALVITTHKSEPLTLYFTYGVMENETSHHMPRKGYIECAWRPEYGNKAVCYDTESGIKVSVPLTEERIEDLEHKYNRARR